jgi:hypothetical protein
VLVHGGKRVAARKTAGRKVTAKKGCQEKTSGGCPEEVGGPKSQTPHHK